MTLFHKACACKKTVAKTGILRWDIKNDFA
jgi:hypothetical protein